MKEGMKMNKEMIKLVQDRIGELVENTVVQNKLIEMKKGGASDQECKAFVNNLAIATLYGVS